MTKQSQTKEKSMTSLRGPTGRQLQDVHPDLRLQLQPQALSPAHVYWSDVPTATIGEANLNGSGVNDSFITGADTNLPYGVAIDSQHIYWCNSAANTIGRANLDGTGVNQSFIPGAGAPYGVAVDSQHVYWTSYSENAIGEANLDGTGVNPTFITGLSSPYGLTVYGQRIYWTSLNGGTIGTANLDGTGVNPTFITGLAHPNGVAVNPQPPPGAPQIFWSDLDVGIGAASLGGLDVIQAYIPVAGAVHDVAISQDVVYFTWANYDDIGGGIGTDQDANFVTGLHFPVGIAVTYVPPPAPPDPCGVLAEELQDLSRSDFPNEADYIRARNDLAESLAECRKAHP